MLTYPYTGSKVFAGNIGDSCQITTHTRFYPIFEPNNYNVYFDLNYNNIPVNLFNFNKDSISSNGITCTKTNTDTLKLTGSSTNPAVSPDFGHFPCVIEAGETYTITFE
jgi:hypothetical protein